MSHLYHYLTKNEDNSRASSFEEGESDVSQDGDQQPILDVAEQVHMGGLFKANWAKRESLKAKKFYIDTTIFMTDFARLGICKYLNMLRRDTAYKLYLSFFSFVPNACMLSKLCYQGSCHLEDPLFF